MTKISIFALLHNFYNIFLLKEIVDAIILWNWNVERKKKKLHKLWENLKGMRESYQFGKIVLIYGQLTMGIGKCEGSKKKLWISSIFLHRVWHLTSNRTNLTFAFVWHWGLSWSLNVKWNANVKLVILLSPFFELKT